MEGVEMKEYLGKLSEECHKKISLIACTKQKSRTELISFYIRNYLHSPEMKIDYEYIRKNGVLKYRNINNDKKYVRIHLLSDDFLRMKKECIKNDVYMNWLIQYLIEQLISEEYREENGEEDDSISEHISE